MTVQSNLEKAIIDHTDRFRALTDPLRLKILLLLRDGEKCVCEIVDAFGESQSKISYHLKQLLDVGLIERRSHGTWAYYSLTGDISRWAEEECRRLQNLPALPETWQLNASSSKCIVLVTGSCLDPSLLPIEQETRQHLEQVLSQYADNEMSFLETPLADVLEGNTAIPAGGVNKITQLHKTYGFYAFPMLIFVHPTETRILTIGGMMTPDRIRDAIANAIDELDE